MYWSYVRLFEAFYDRPSLNGCVIPLNWLKAFSRKTTLLFLTLYKQYVIDETIEANQVLVAGYITINI